MDVREFLPDVNVSKLLSQYPHLIFQLEPGKVSQQLHLLRSEFSAAHAEIMLFKRCRYSVNRLSSSFPNLGAQGLSIHSCFTTCHAFHAAELKLTKIPVIGSFLNVFADRQCLSDQFDAILQA
jgi:hypothetical protein